VDGSSPPFFFFFPALQKQAWTATGPRRRCPLTPLLFFPSPPTPYRCGRLKKGEPAASSPEPKRMKEATIFPFPFEPPTHIDEGSAEMHALPLSPRKRPSTWMRLMSASERHPHTFFPFRSFSLYCGRLRSNGVRIRRHVIPFFFLLYSLGAEGDTKQVPAFPPPPQSSLLFSPSPPHR